MDPEDYPSDSDVSDEDFRPDKADSESESEVESEDNINENDADNENGDEATSCGKKRKRKIKKVGKKKTKLESKRVDAKEPAKDPTQQDELLDDEDEERKTDALWADFLAGTGSSSNSSNTLSKEPAKKDQPKTSISSGASNIVEKPTIVKKIFEFAGEAVEVTEVVPASKAEESSKPSKPALTTVSSNTTVGSPRPLVGRSSGGGLGAVLGQIGKKNKLSTLEKTKLDWTSFKRNEGIEEELQTHNKGKDGFLERQDFLQRADLRQFEIEKSFRQSKSKR